jgi:hypothetical protein
MQCVTFSARQGHPSERNRACGVRERTTREEHLKCVQKHVCDWVTVGGFIVSKPHVSFVAQPARDHFVSPPPAACFGTLAYEIDITYHYNSRFHQFLEINDCQKQNVPAWPAHEPCSGP